MFPNYTLCNRTLGLAHAQLGGEMVEGVSPKWARAKTLQHGKF